MVEHDRKVQISAFVWALVFGSRLQRSRTLAGFRHSYNSTADETISPGGFYHWLMPSPTLRKRLDTLVYGDYELLASDHEQVYAYARTHDTETVLVVLNWSASPAVVSDLDTTTDDADLLFANTTDAPADPGGATLQPYEATVYLLRDGSPSRSYGPDRY